jgi:predicted DNA-binding transcriptional regulator AlpA
MAEQADTGIAPGDPIAEASVKMIAEIENYLWQQAQPRTAVMDEYAAAEYIGCSVSWLRNNRRSAATPPFVKVGKNVRYRIESLDEWLKQQEVKH